MARPVAIVTGAGSGIGAAIAARLADRNDLILTHLHDDPDPHNALAAAEQRGATTVAVTGDLTDPLTIDMLAHEAEHASDRLEVLVSNAAPHLPPPRRHLRLRQRLPPSPPPTRGRHHPGKPHDQRSLG